VLDKEEATRNEQVQVVLDRIAAGQRLERQRRSISRTIAKLEQNLAEIPRQLETQDAALEQELAAIERDLVQTRTGAELLVKAPAAGIVANRTVEADILGESRKLYEWVLEPLYSVYGSVGGRS